MRCCASNLSRLLLPMSKQVTDGSCDIKSECDALFVFVPKPNWQIFTLDFLLLHSGPINREMRHLISTLQTHNQQMKGEVVKYKLRLREAQAELNQVSEMEARREIKQ